MDHNRRLLLFRPAIQAVDFAADLEARLPGRFHMNAVPLTETVPIDTPLPMEGVQGIVLTSATAARVLADRGLPAGLPVWCVGDQTAATARAAGFEAFSAAGDATSLAALLTRAAAPGAGPLLYLHGWHVATDLGGALERAGFAVHAVAVYEERPIPIPGPIRDRLAAGAGDTLAFFSPRMARLFATQARAASWPLARNTAVVISANVATALADLGLGGCRTAGTPDRQGMIEALARL